MAPVFSPERVPQQLTLFGAAPVRQTPRAPRTGPRELDPPRSKAPSGQDLAIFRHPDANREVLLAGQAVAYAFKRARRRSIGFVVGTEGLSVSAPKWTGVREIEVALHEKAPWILRKLRDQHALGQRLEATRVGWHDGTSIPFLGAHAVVVLDPAARWTDPGAVLKVGGDRLSTAPGMALYVGLPHAASPEEIRDAVKAWLKREARVVFEDRCAHFAARLGVRCTRLSLSSAQTRWGSATADGSIRINWRLIHLAMPSIDYVVVHELAHLREMNHSARFWSVVRSVLPDYERTRASLKDGVVPLLD